MELNLKIGGCTRKFQVVQMICSPVPGPHLKYELVVKVVEQPENKITLPYEEKLVILFTGSSLMANSIREMIEQRGGIESPDIFQKIIEIAKSRHEER